MSVEQLTAVPAESLLRSELPGYGPTYLLTYDAGDGEIMFTTAGGDQPGFLTATEALEDHGPFQLIHHGIPAPTLTGGLVDHDPWAL